MDRTYYLAGPMSGKPQLNFPAFDAAAAALRANGYTIISPAELDDPAERQAALLSDGSQYTKGSWGDYLSRDVKIVADKVTGIILLPDWQESRGARLECYVGLLCNHEFRLYYANGIANEVDPLYVRSFI